MCIIYVCVISNTRRRRTHNFRPRWKRDLAHSLHVQTCVPSLVVSRFTCSLLRSSIPCAVRTSLRCASPVRCVVWSVVIYVDFAVSPCCQWLFASPRRGQVCRVRVLCRTSRRLRRSLVVLDVRRRRRCDVGGVLNREMIRLDQH